MLRIDPKCVLVVDDDDSIRGLVCDLLSEAGYRVERANSGQQALGKIGTARPDVIILDLMMPTMDGWTFLRLWRAHPLGGDKPVMLLSAYTGLEESASALTVQGFLKKPFELTDLLDSVERLVQPPSPGYAQA